MPWINHLPPVCWSTFGILVWNDSGYVNLTQWWYFFIIFEYILHISTPHIMIFCFPLPYFPLSQQVLYFLLSTLVLTLYIDVVLSLSISSSYFPQQLSNLHRDPKHFSIPWAIRIAQGIRYMSVRLQNDHAVCYHVCVVSGIWNNVIICDVTENALSRGEQ